MSKKKIFKIIGMILLIVIVLVLIHTIRNYIIISDLQEKVEKYLDSTNYYIKSIATENGGTIVTMEYYRKDNKEVVFLERNLNGEISKISMYNNGERIDTFAENKEVKTAQLNSANLMSINIISPLETTNKWQTFLGSIFANVKSTNYNGKDCYIVKNFMSLPSDYNAKTYIEKDTGLFVKEIQKESSNEKEYEFDNVDDSIFVEPDISQYTLKVEE